MQSSDYTIQAGVNVFGCVHQQIQPAIILSVVWMKMMNFISMPVERLGTM